MEPAVKPAALATRSGVVGVLATRATLRAEGFLQLAERFADGVELLMQPCPGLVEQVEAGELTEASPRTLELLRHYLDPLLARGTDTLVLGCTHYPFLRETIARLAGPQVKVVDSGEAVARQTARVLDQAGLRAPADRLGTTRFFSGAADLEAERPIVERLWGEPVRLERLPV
jgi:glutamate racemase